MSRRSELLTLIDALIEETGRGTAAIWSERSAELFCLADELNREWVADRLQDAVYRLGLSHITAEAERLLASKGMVSWNDDAPAESHARYWRFSVDGSASGMAPWVTVPRPGRAAMTLMMPCGCR